MWKRLKNFKETILKLLFRFYENGQKQKIKVKVWVYSLDKYLYILTKNRLTLRDRTYTINQTDDDLLEWEKNNLWEKVFCILEGEKRYRKQGGKKRYRRQTGKGFPIRLLESAAAQILGEVAIPIF